MRSPENRLSRFRLQILLASLFIISACSSPSTKASEPTYLIQYKLVACQETDIVNRMCDGRDKRLPFSYEAYDSPGVLASDIPEVNNGEVYFTNRDFPGGHSVPDGQIVENLCLREINPVDTFPEQIRFDLIFDSCN
ncbi:hypothetical protein KBD69_03670 [Candidatus Woesebacteria bacterium]|nr:hypothetical protein [Candidatus Woesebacteria bacterium]